MPIRAVVFDLFDTLVDLMWEKLPWEEYAGRRLPSSTRTLHEAVAERADVDFDRFARALDDGARAFRESHFAEGREVPTRLRFEDLLARLAVEDDGLAERLTRLHMDVLRGAVEVLPHHVEVLTALRERARIAVCSNFSHTETALSVLDQAGLRELLDVTVVSESVGLRKPRPEIFGAVLEGLDARPDEVLHVGDSLRADVGGASALGIVNVWITRRVSDPDKALAEHEGPKPDHTVEDLAEVAELLERLSG